MGAEIMSRADQGVSFIIPAYNEEQGISETIETLDSTLKKAGVEYEIIVVDDGSSDQTYENAAKFKDITVISHPVNAGYGRSIKTGISNSKYGWIGIIDADGTYPIDKVPQLIENMKKGFDMVIAARDNLEDHDSFMKSFFRKIYKSIVKIAFHADLKDPNSGLRIFSREIAMMHFPFLCDTFSFTTSLTVLFYGRGAFIDHIPITYKKRLGKSKVRTIRDSITTSLLIIQGLTFYNPILFFIFLSVGIILLVCIPAMVLAMFSMLTLSLYYMVFGSLISVLIAFGVLVDAVRITSVKDDHRTI
jgi:polyisoprenyl-phosphate glycosyltransferase